MPSSFFDSQALKDWFESQKRPLPWRDNPTPYIVWVSEVMLQQTQVTVVIPYFERWMQQFPTLSDLAKAPLNAVIKAWEGLGYYSRARHLHAGAQYVLNYHAGILPEDESSLKKIKGLGPYTISAIRSFAFHHRAAAVDGNVIRVLARYGNISDDISSSKTVQRLRQHAQDILPHQQPWIIAEALIELGATICTKSPKCQLCPLKNSCEGYIQGTASSLPYKSKKTKIEKLYRAVSLISGPHGEILVRKVESGKIMSDLHEFPYFETCQEGLTHQAIEQKISAELHLKVALVEALKPIQHSFTRYQVTLFPAKFSCNELLTVPGYQWMTPPELQQAAFSSGHRRLLQNLQI